MPNAELDAENNAGWQTVYDPNTNRYYAVQRR
jgi:hypothetical protein